MLIYMKCLKHSLAVLIYVKCLEQSAKARQYKFRLCPVIPKLLSLCVPQLCHLQNINNNSTYKACE